MFGWGYFAPVVSRVSARQPSYFFLRRQKKGEPRPCPSGSLRYSQRSGHLQTLRLEISTPLNRLRRFPLQGRHQRPGKAGSAVSLVGAALRWPRPNGLFAALTSRGLGCLISHASLLSRARHAVPLQLAPSFLTPHFSSWATTRVAPTPSLLPQGNHKGCPYAPHSSLLRPHSSLLTPTTSPLTPPPALPQSQQSPGHSAHGNQGYAQQ